MGRELTETDFANLRRQMVEDQLRRRGMDDERVLAAMGTVPRHEFVPTEWRSSAYNDAPLSLELGQTISQPYIVARMTELLRLTAEDRVLEIGTGSGYQAAVLATLAGEVWSMERHAELARKAEERLTALGYHNVHVLTGDGTLGYLEAAPYDAIIVTAAAPQVPEALRAQLAINGRMIIPVTAGHAEELLLIERLSDYETGPTPSPRYRETSILGCTFVPLIGEQGYPL